VKAGVEKFRQAGCVTELGCQRKVEPLWVFPGAVNQIINAEDRDVIHQQSDDDFVNLPAGAQCPGDSTPEPSQDKGGQEHACDHQGVALDAREKSYCGSAAGAHINLTFGADVPDLHAKGEGNPEAGKDQRCRLDQGFREAVSRAQRFPEDFEIGLQRVDTGCK